eukprot:5958988-Pleurochrysis_carterae.AAC.1
MKVFLNASGLCCVTLHTMLALVLRNEYLQNEVFHNRQRRNLHISAWYAGYYTSCNAFGFASSGEVVPSWANLRKPVCIFIQLLALTAYESQETKSRGFIYISRLFMKNIKQ